jgi:enoyl-CoA hydratase
MSNMVKYELQDSVATITMDDGKVNALSVQMFAELNAAFDLAKTDKATVVFTGRVNRFSAGFDLGELRAGGDGAAALLRAGFELAERMLSFPTPVVVACNGHAIAMGVFLLLSGDYRIGVDGPYKINANEVALGMTMPRTAIEICRQRLAPAHYSRAIILAEPYSPADAVTAGFLDRVVEASELQSVARTTASLLANLNMNAHAASKLRAREHALTAIRAAIEADDADFQNIAGMTAAAQGA